MEYGRSTRSRDFRAVLPFTRKYTKTKFEGVFFRQSAKRDLRTGLRPTEIFKLRGQDVDGNACGLYIIQKGGKRVFVRLPEDMIRMLQAYTRKPAEPIFQQPRKKTAFEKHPSVSRPPSESSIWLRKTATVCTPSPCTP